MRVNIEESFFKLWAFAYGIPVLTTVIPFATSSYGEEDLGFCWLDKEHFGDLWKLL